MVKLNSKKNGKNVYSSKLSLVGLTPGLNHPITVLFFYDINCGKTQSINL
jgi:hypothetical protein